VKGKWALIIANIYEQARQHPQKIALVYNCTKISYAAFVRAIDAMRLHLASYEPRAGSVAITRCNKLLDSWLAGLALRSLGLTTLAVPSLDVIPKLGLRNIGCVVGDADAARPDIGGSESWQFVRLPTNIIAGVSDGQTPHMPEIGRLVGGHIVLTSATTGAPKKVMMDLGTEAIAFPLGTEINGISERSVVYVPNFGLWTSGGYDWAAETWNVGGTVVIHDAPDMQRPFALYNITHIFSTPDHLSRLLGAPEGALRRNDAMRLIVTSGAMSQALAAKAADRLTSQVITALASTEAWTVAMTPIEQPEDLRWHRIHPLRKVEVVDETGQVLPAEQVGLVRVPILGNINSYLDDEEASRAFFRDGYFYPGDLGAFGPDGRLALHGRVTDVINVRGVKIPTMPIEQQVQDWLGAEGVCVFSMPGQGPDEEIHVVIQSRRRIERSELETIIRAMPPVFRRVHFHFVDSLPRNETGKIQRLLLKQQLEVANTGEKARLGATHDR
jgi:phenylacetate-coenzyme A ligase PaaK-like adenylate-forming protein